ncbi:MAG: hypothetical protein JRF63_07000 [Deltaproteobacteria bacterium]|nr:hypothetical protein [Deltaproteobacteria bacterium]
MKGVLRLVGMAALAAVMLVSAQALAQGEETAGPAAPDQPVEAKGVGVSGGVIVGAELVLAIEALIGVEDVWPWVVFPILGGAGGGVGGYFLEGASPEGAVALLVSGMVFIIPVAVGISASTAYDPEVEGAVKDTTGDGTFSFELPASGEEPLDEGTSTEVESRPEDVPDGAPALPPEDAPTEPPPAETPAPDAPSPDQQRLRHLTSGSLFHVGSDFDAGFGVPAIDVRPTVRTGEELLLGANQGLEVHVPLIKIDLP